MHCQLNVSVTSQTPIPLETSVIRWFPLAIQACTALGHGFDSLVQQEHKFLLMHRVTTLVAQMHRAGTMALIHHLLVVRQQERRVITGLVLPAVGPTQSTSPTAKLFMSSTW